MFHTYSPRSLILYLVLFSFIGSLLAGLLQLLVTISLPATVDQIWTYRINIVLQDVFVLFLPAYLLFKRAFAHPLQKLGITQNQYKSSTMLFPLLLFIVLYPAISVIAQWNEQLSLPSSLQSIEQWMRQMEEAAKVVTDQFLSKNGAFDLFLNVLIIAGLAAIAEEIFFRGALQPLFEKWFGNEHLAVWITAFVFSAIHLQFFGFFPRLLLGAVLGYLYVYSRNLWVPILYHFLNNFIVVIVVSLWSQTDLYKKMDAMELDWASLLTMLISLVIGFYLLIRYRAAREPRSNITL